ncbi:MAG TPA: putative sulfate exporter family transporter [Acidobacteriaceae bacterium]|nr:putative sulfate exporter family transporter [Acidobacteriaceae bacterium]
MASQTIAVSQEAQSQGVLRHIAQLLPGVLLLFAVGLAGKGLERLGLWLRTTRHIYFPQVEYVLWAILLGLLIGNVFKLPAIFRAGLATYELWLKLGIVLVGAKFLFGDMLHLGGLSLVLVAVELALSLTVMTLLGRWFRLRPKLTSLLAIGSSICGVTAIMAAQGALETDEEDTSTAIAAILALGAIALFAFPALGHMLHMGQQSYGLWTGLAVDNTAEATVTGAIYGDEAGRIAILAKTARSGFIGFVVLGYAVYWASRGQTHQVQHKGRFLWQKFPKFILGFVAISLLATIGFFSSGQLASLSNLSKWAFLPAFAGVGLRTRLSDLVNQGWRPILTGVLGEIFIALVTLGLVFVSTHGAIH